MARFSFAGLRMRLIFPVLGAVIPAWGLMLNSFWQQRQHAIQKGPRQALSLEKSVSKAVHSDGVPFAGAPPLTGPVTYADRNWYRPRLETKDFVISEYLFGKRAGKPILVFSNPVFAHPVLNQENRLNAFVIAYDHRVNCYITKPVDFSQFTQVVNSIEDFWFTGVKLPRE